MSLPQYKRYRQSGADWLGIIPDHWSAVRVKTVFEIRKRIAGELGHDVLSVTQQGLKIRNTDSNDGQLSMDYSKYQLVEPDDFVMNHMDLLTGYVDVSKFHGVTSPDYRVFTARKKEVSLKFFLYLFQNGYRQRIFYAFGQGASGLGRWRMPTDSFNDFILPVPPLSEQTAIATFLDHETSKIDALVEEQQQLIELLKEKRQAVISRAVTKGIDPNETMKDPGVEWLGEVPEHWDVMTLRRLSSRVQTGRTPTTENPAADTEGLPWFTPGDFGGDLRLSTAAKNISHACVEANDANLFPPGSVLIVSIGATLGRVGFSDRLCSGNQQINAVPPCDAMKGLFLAYSLSVKAEMMRFLSNASTIGIMNQEKTKEVVLAVPPLSEQSAIVEFLGATTHSLNALAEEAEKVIALLQERRGALISAAVTGKIDVRGLVEAHVPIPDVVAA
ncbi:restriction endonuclease subunit S [Bradyrhizobium sp. AZCC 2289]|uniref:restriction endonuclease subunit S n=1 Tax=Bradyrhizobium sp. AZCC 2289 TaxID=3117026 RepID=UPI002FEF5566